MKISKIYLSLVVVVMTCGLVFTSCGSDQLSDDNEKITPAHLWTILSDAGWEEKDDSGLVQDESSPRTKSCKWEGASEGIPCDGGDCRLLENFMGHDACLGCEIDGVITGDLACTGSNGLVYYVTLMHEIEPTLSINYGFMDPLGGNNIDEGEGTLQELIEKIEEISITHPSAEFSFRMY